MDYYEYEEQLKWGGIVNPRDIYYIYDDPIPFKNDLKLYPVSMRDYLYFFTYAQCLTLEKNSIQGDVQLAMKAISMSYLEYLYYVSQTGEYSETNPSPADFLHALFRLTFRLPEETKASMRYQEDGKPIFSIDGDVYDSNDFDLFREIVSEQNELELPNEKIQKNVRDSLEEARRYKRRASVNKTAGLEDQILSVAIFTGWTPSYIYDLSIRKFIRTLHRANHMILQDAYLHGEMGGMVKFKEPSPVVGWLADIDKEDDYSDVSMDLDSLQNKVNFNEAKEKAAGK
jgi:hypothetical protein